jgi:pyruvate kinase
MQRRTKIVCTLGPASADILTIRSLVRAGLDVVRLNLSHGTHAYHDELIRNVRSVAESEGCTIPILLDLQGPKIRVGEIETGSCDLVQGSRVRVSVAAIHAGNAEEFSVDYPGLTADIAIGGEILLDDGRLELRVEEIADDYLMAEVVVGGRLLSRKGVNLPNIRTSTPSLTEKDLRDLEFALERSVDIIALSFVRDESDVADLKKRIAGVEHRPMIIAKIEKPEAVDRIDAIIDEADGIMVARGDLGIEMRLSRVPGTQKSIISKCLVAAKPVITATQMLESMIEQPRPTRAEVSDVANAVLDGSDAVMLSGETAIGKYPVRSVEVMSDVIVEAEKDAVPPVLVEEDGAPTTIAVSLTAHRLARQINSRAIVCLTASGATARFIARHRPGVPVYAFTDDKCILGQLALTWGTKGFHIPFQCDTDKGIALVHQILREQRLVVEGDLVVITAGMPLPAKGRTNMVQVSKV